MEIGMSTLEYLKKTLDDEMGPDDVAQMLRLMQSKLGKAYAKMLADSKLPSELLGFLENNKPEDEVLSIAFHVLKTMNYHVEDKNIAEYIASCQSTRTKCHGRPGVSVLGREEDIAHVLALLQDNRESFFHLDNMEHLYEAMPNELREVLGRLEEVNHKVKWIATSREMFVVGGATKMKEFELKALNNNAAAKLLTQCCGPRYEANEMSDSDSSTETESSLEEITATSPSPSLHFENMDTDDCVQGLNKRRRSSSGESDFM
ncbi:hypothetical protein MAR_023663 [Mya arenaria]|uniref:Uncharacterized protein n=1 Tax=Mya arenaria TaxID=6604 RepID=A0ABY7DWG9_MYAAR|nr:hypothetical protein MAR_023663 [Mya arenaria]